VRGRAVTYWRRHPPECTVQLLPGHLSTTHRPLVVFSPDHLSVPTPLDGDPAAQHGEDRSPQPCTGLRAFTSLAYTHADVRPIVQLASLTGVWDQAAVRIAVVSANTEDDAR
jgi:hypothetical protein